MNVTNKPNVIPAGTVMNGTIKSLTMQLQNNMGYNFQIFFTGTPGGNFRLQASDENPATQTAAGQTPYTATLWTDVASSIQTVSAAGNVMWNVMWANYNFVQVLYTDTSGGTSTAVITSATFNSKC